MTFSLIVDVLANARVPQLFIRAPGTLAQARSSRGNATGVSEMDKDRVEGSAEQAKGKVKEVAGKAVGDEKLKTEGKADQVKGKVQNAVGGLKDTLKGE
jgi:uncharacterized protein YjbJ (UPF0337 family)